MKRIDAKSLIIELERVARLVDYALIKAQNEASARGLLFSGIAANLKFRYATDELEERLWVLVADFNASNDMLQMNEFIDDVKTTIDILRKRVAQWAAILIPSTIAIVIAFV